MALGPLHRRCLGHARQSHRARRCHTAKCMRKALATICLAHPRWNLRYPGFFSADGADASALPKRERPSRQFDYAPSSVFRVHFHLRHRYPQPFQSRLDKAPKTTINRHRALVLHPLPPPRRLPRISQSSAHRSDVLQQDLGAQEAQEEIWARRRCSPSPAKASQALPPPAGAATVWA